MNLLPDGLAAQARSGDFDGQIINYVNPKDAIGAGPFEEYERHVGATYYLGEDFETANGKYDGMRGCIARFIDSISGDNYRSMEHYMFNADGSYRLRRRRPENCIA
ncbi:hypothetical protein [Paenibacillus sp. OSY-SE]|uniref:hypothetical protein n=1 Tax=Paenibacillus sp. OSY-SE TaxID=1196323 RepID=UPI00036C46B7|nr:hypothetical protein [Paenibacillus sp. OSY-SE]